MLGRAVARGVAWRSPTPITFRATAAFHSSRPFLKSDRPRRPPPSRPEGLSNGATPTGPIPNRTWAPEHGINFRPRRQDQAEDPSAEQLEIDTPPATDPSNTPAGRPTPLGSGATRRDAETQGTDYSVQQPEFESVASPTKGKDPEIETSAPEDKLRADAEEQNPFKGPLPDLRQGIPSTFEQEYSDRSSSFKTKDAESPSLNITEDPADPGSRRAGSEGQDLPKDAYVSSIDRRRNAFARYAYLTAFGFLAASAVWLGQKWQSDEEAQKHPEVSNSWTPGAVYARIKARLSETLGYYTEPAFPKLLPELDPSYGVPPYTLVLSLEDLLVNSKWSRQKGYEIAKRPGVDYFLRYMSMYYEIVLFTTVQRMNAEPIIMKLDPYRLVMFPLYREATRYINGEHVKDLSYLNRDLRKTILLDTVPGHARLQPDNSVIIPKWSGTKDDPHANDLVAMIPFLEYIAAMNIEDVRKVIKSFEGTHIPTEFARRESKARSAFNAQLEAERSRSSKIGSLGGAISGMIGFKPGQQLLQIPGEPSFAESYAQGKMLSDQMRERGQRQFELMDKELRENGDKMVEGWKAEEKKAVEEQMKTMQSGVAGFFPSLFGLGGSSSASTSSSSGGDTGKK